MTLSLQHTSRATCRLCAQLRHVWSPGESRRQVAAVALPVLAVAAKYLRTGTDPQIGKRTVTNCMHSQRRSGCRDLSANRTECYMLQRTDLCS